jgi:TolB protein
MKVVYAPSPQLDDLLPADAEALIEEARRRQRHRRFAVAGATAAVIAGLVAYLSVSRTSVPPKAPAATSLTTASPGPIVDAKAFHGHGNLAFVSRDQLYVLDGSTGKLTAVTSGTRVTGAPSAPSFSPNGKWLAYSFGNGGAGVANADGTSAETIMTTGSSPGWMPNNELLVGTTLFRLSPSGRAITAGSVSPDLVGWAPDGSGYAFVQPIVKNGPNGSFRGVEQLQLANTLTGTRTVWRSTSISFARATGFHGNFVKGVIVLPHHGGLLFWVDPDQSASLAADGMRVYEVRSARATPIDLAVTVGQTVSVGSNGVLAIGSGGNRYAWMTKTVETCVIATANCSDVRTPAGDVTIDPAWSPNGKTLAFVEAPSSSASDFFQPTLTKWYSTHHLWLLSSSSSVPTEVRDTAGASVPVWSSNGKSVLYESGDALWLIGRPGATPTQVASPLFWSGAWPSYYGQIDWSGQFSWSAS